MRLKEVGGAAFVRDNTLESLLILGTGKDQIFGIEKAKKMGLYAIGLDMNELSDGVKLVDEFYKVNIKDESEVEKFIYNYNKPIDGIIAFGVDIPEVLARIAELKGLPYYTDYKTALISKDKYRAKERMREYGVRSPRYLKVSTLEEFMTGIKEIGYPCILKPVDNSGARGVLRITGGVDLEWAFEYSKAFSKSGDLILEEFLDGMQISSESFIIDGNVYTVGLSDRNYEFLNKFAPFVIENGGDLPPNLTDDQRNNIDEQIARCARAFNVKNGIIKGDLVIYGEEVFVIEVALRLSGGHFSSLEIPLNTGIDFLRCAIYLSLGKEIDVRDLEYKVEQHVGLRYLFPDKKGIIKKLGFPEWFKEDETIKACGFYCGPGDYVNYPVRSHPERLGFFLVASESLDKLEDVISLAYQDTVVYIE